VTAHRASIELSQVIRISDRAGGPEPPTDGVVTPVRAYLLGPAEPVLWALLAGSGLMLLVACANVAGLQVSRAARRQRALAIRLALGAHHMDLMRQTLIESLLLTTAAVVLATGVSSLVVQALLQLAPSEVARLDSVTLFDPWVASAGAGLALATLLLCGSWPAMVARRVDACRVAHARRRRELAIRAALGASARRLRSAVLREAVGLVALGCTAGLAVSLAIGRGLASALIGVAPHDAWALTASCGLTMAIGLFACWAPARRAATADPVEALKGD
jgi:putative ABC transport system permease protein